MKWDLELKNTILTKSLKTQCIGSAAEWKREQKESVNELEDRTIEIAQYKQQIENRLKERKVLKEHMGL